ncbi:MAG: IPT/TIG domain-containing protein [Sphingobacteriales bacterium]
MRKKILLSNFVAVAAFLQTGMLLIESCSKKNDSPGLQISSFVPSSAAKDSIVIISGKNFGLSVAGITVSFNGVAGSVLTANDSVLTVKVPVHAHDGKITVQANGKTGNSVGNFTYIYTVSTLAGDGTGAFKNGTGTAAEFNYPSGVAADAFGNIYVGDVNNNQIRKITSGGTVSTLAGDGTRAYKDSTGILAQFDNPYGIATDGSGNVYVADRSNQRIRKITPAGVVTTLAGNSTAGYKDSTGKLAQFDYPQGVAADGSGNVYVSDEYNHRIRKITPAGAVSTLAGDGTAAYKEGTGTLAQFYYPHGVATDGSGNVYVADTENQRIRKITTSGVVSTLAGNGRYGYKDSIGAMAQFNYPAALAVDASGNVYVADSYNNRIRKITPAGAVSTVAGDGTGAYKDGAGAIAQFNYPSSIAVDGFGNIYVADTNNNRIRKIE